MGGWQQFFGTSPVCFFSEELVWVVPCCVSQSLMGFPICINHGAMLMCLSRRPLWGTLSLVSLCCLAKLCLLETLLWSEITKKAAFEPTTCQVYQIMDYNLKKQLLNFPLPWVGAHVLTGGLQGMPWPLSWNKAGVHFWLVFHSHVMRNKE